MNRLLLSCIAASSIAAAGETDLLRFGNGDQLHGTFGGISAAGPSVLWQRDGVDGEVAFRSSEIRQIVLRNSRPSKALANLSHIGLANGDRVPGTIRELNENRALFETEFGGTLEIPRNRIGLIAPSPLGGRVLYHGPFDPDEWTLMTNEFPDGFSARPPEDEKENESANAARWMFSGAAWYWQNESSGTALVRKNGMPDRAILQFDLAWKNRLALALAFHSDFTRPPEDEEDENANRASRNQSLPRIFGSSYVLHLYTNYVMLYRTSFDEAGRPSLERVQTHNSNIRLGDTGKANVEIRCNRQSGEIVLFINGEFVVQWSELKSDEILAENSGYAGLGDGFGFFVQNENSPVRISEIVLAEWNGMPDAARSLQVDDADIVLLTNGTDRFSGRVTSIRDGKMKLESRYGDFNFPMEEVAEVRFAKSSLHRSTEIPTDEISIRFHPIGRLSGKALEGDANKLRILNDDIGEIQVSLESAVMLELQPSNSFLDDWDPEF